MAEGLSPHSSKRGVKRPGVPRLAASAASLAFAFAVLYGFGILPFVGLARHYSTTPFDAPLRDGGSSEDPRSLLAAAAAAPGDDVIARFHSALRALRDFNKGSSSDEGANASIGGGMGGSGVVFEPVPGGGGLLLPAAPCPDELALGVHPPLHTPDLFGNRCEPWAARRVVTLLALLLAPGMAGLEWGAGGSTGWYLSRLGRLATVEHNASWAEAVASLARRAFPADALVARWELHVVPPARPALTFAEAEAYEPFKKYADVSFLEKGGRLPRFDLISVDGQARLACFQRALWLLKSHGGVLVLNGSQRRAYREVAAMVPPHWLRYSEGSVLGGTTLWVSCDQGRCGT